MIIDYITAVFKGFISNEFYNQTMMYIYAQRKLITHNAQNDDDVSRVTLLLCPKVFMIVPKTHCLVYQRMKKVRHSIFIDVRK